jgi:HD superfamily phosphohydrolase
MCGVRTAFDHQRLMAQARVMDDGGGLKACFHAKQAPNVHSLFRARETMFRAVYCHRAGKSVEYMITDALLEANAALGHRFSRASTDPKQFACLTDCVLREVEASPKASLKSAQRILKRLRRRKLYAFADQWSVPRLLAFDDRFDWKKEFTPETIASRNPRAGSIDGELRPEELIVQHLKMSWGNRGVRDIVLLTFAKSLHFSLSNSAQFLSCVLPT